MPGDSPVLIVSALPEELAAISARARELQFGTDRSGRGRLGSAAVVIAATGDGGARASRRAGELCDAHRPSLLLGAGVAGALSDELAVGEMVASRSVRDAEGAAPPPDPRLLARALAIPGVRGVTLMSVARPAVTRSEKARLEEAAGGAPAAVDMESAAWAREAARRGIPYLVLRAISDAAADELPGYLSDCMDAQGSIRRSSVVGRALAHPFSIPVLLRMRRAVLDGSRRLAALLEHFLAEGA